MTETYVMEHEKNCPYGARTLTANVGVTTSETDKDGPCPECGAVWVKG